MKKAFTLAEVLITLGIIGVVAAITLPSVINNTKNKELSVALKRSYSLLQQALDMYAASNGERATSANLQPYTLKFMLMKYLRFVKDCGIGTDIPKSCVPNFDAGGSAYDEFQRTYKTYNGKTNISMYYTDDGQFVLNDSTLILIENSPAGNNIYITVDVNGYNKNPNRLGQDVFMFELDDKGALKPMGVHGTAYYSISDSYCSLTSGSNMNGAGCTYKALSEPDFFSHLPK